MRQSEAVPSLNVGQTTQLVVDGMMYFSRRRRSPRINARLSALSPRGA